MMGIPKYIKTTKGDVHDHYHCWNRFGQERFAVHGVDNSGKAALVKPKVARDKLLELVANGHFPNLRVPGEGPLPISSTGS